MPWLNVCTCTWKYVHTKMPTQTGWTHSLWWTFSIFSTRICESIGASIECAYYYFLHQFRSFFVLPPPRPVCLTGSILRMYLPADLEHIYTRIHLPEPLYVLLTASIRGRRGIRHSRNSEQWRDQRDDSWRGLGARELRRLRNRNFFEWVSGRSIKVWFAYMKYFPEWIALRSVL